MSKPQGAGTGEPPTRREMLVQVLLPGERVLRQDPWTDSDLAEVMNDRHGGKMPNVPARPTDPPAEIHFFREEEEPLVETARRVESFPAREHEGPRSPVTGDLSLVHRHVELSLAQP